MKTGNVTPSIFGMLDMNVDLIQRSFAAVCAGRDACRFQYPHRSLARLLLLGLVLVGEALADPVTINPGTSTYDYHPATARTGDGSAWVAWHGYRLSQDQILARHVGADGQVGELHVVSESGTAHGPPVVMAEAADDVRVVWAMKTAAGWRVVLRRMTQGDWQPAVTLSDLRQDAIFPTAVPLADGSFYVAWSAHSQGRWRIYGVRISDGQADQPRAISSSDADGMRPRLVVHEGAVWSLWDEHRHDYSVHARRVWPDQSPIEQVSPAGDYCLTPTGLSHTSGLYAAWLRKVDVLGGPGVVSQHHSFHAAVRRAGQWHLIRDPDGGSMAAELTHGLMAKIDPEPVATGGYLGPRLRPMLAASNDRVWLLWERKSDHRGRTASVPGDLLGRSCVRDRWQPPVVLAQQRIDYHVADPRVLDGRIKLLASRLPQRAIRTYEMLDVKLDSQKPMQQDAWTGWQPVQLPIPSEMSPPRSITANDKTYRLYWADLHCHNGLTTDAEGEPDELFHYARDRARLDVVVFTNNDFYNVPLTQYDYEVGNLFARVYSAADDSKRRGMLCLPGFEWTSKIPPEGKGSLTDPSNWLPPYLKGSYPNHRSVIYPPGGGPLVHFPEVGNDIARLNEAVAEAGGITLSQHDAFKLSGHPVEVGMELTSGWRNYIVRRPRLFHDPLDRGARLGFTANGDTHRRAPGLSGALTGIYAESLTAEAIMDALRERRCFATMGSRIFIDSRAGEALMGEETRASGGSIRLTLQANGTRPITRAVLVHHGKEIFTAVGDGTTEIKTSYTAEGLPVGTHWFYWRIEQTKVARDLPGNLMPAHGHLAWASPHWVVCD